MHLKLTYKMKMRFSSFNAMFFRYQKTYLYAGRYFVSNRDCVGVQWINPCINGSGRLMACDCKSSFAGPFGLDRKSFRSEWFDSTLRTRLNERKCKWNETRIFDWENASVPSKPDISKCSVHTNLNMRNLSILRRLSRGQTQQVRMENVKVWS